jgi:hypothetical protein
MIIMIIKEQKKHQQLRESLEGTFAMSFIEEVEVTKWKQKSFMNTLEDLYEQACIKNNFDFTQLRFSLLGKYVLVTIPNLRAGAAGLLYTIDSDFYFGQEFFIQVCGYGYDGQIMDGRGLRFTLTDYDALRRHANNIISITPQ